MPGPCGGRARTATPGGGRGKKADQKASLPAPKRPARPISSPQQAGQDRFTGWFLLGNKIGAAQRATPAGTCSATLLLRCQAVRPVRWRVASKTSPLGVTIECGCNVSHAIRLCVSGHEVLAGTARKRGVCGSRAALALRLPAYDRVWQAPTAHLPCNHHDHQHNQRHPTR